MTPSPGEVKGLKKILKYNKLKNTYNKLINPLALPSAGAPALKYGDVNTVTPSPS